MAIFQKKKIVATILLTLLALGGWYASEEDWLVDYEFKVKVQRDYFRDSKVSPDVVVVGLDLKSYLANSQLPWPRRHLAQIIDNLNKYGVERIFLDGWLKKSPSAADDKLLVDSFNNSRAEIVIGAGIVEGDGGKLEKAGSDAVFLKNAKEVGIVVDFNRAGQPYQIPYRALVGDSNLKSLTAELAGRDGALEEVYALDYSFDWKKVPVVSAIDVLNDEVDPAKLAGKTVVYGYYTTHFGDHYTGPHGERMPGVATHLVGANQLMNGRPVTVDKGLPIMFALIFSFLLVWICRPSLSIFLSLVAIPLAFALSVYLDSKFIVVENLPAFALLIFGAAYHRAAIYVDRLNEARRVDHESGLPNTEAFVEDLSKPGLHTICCIHIAEYDFLRRSLTTEQLRRFLAAVSKRLSLVSNEIYQGTDGSLYFAMRTEKEEEIRNSLESIRLIFLNPMPLDEHMLNIKAAFGYDMEFLLPLQERIGHALVAACSAESASRHVARYSPSLLEQEQLTISVQQDIRKAMQNGELAIVIQTQRCLQKGWSCSGEALVRWNHPERGVVGPAEFMAIIEKSPLIHEFTLHVIVKAIEALQKILKINPDYQLSINVPPILMTDTEFMDDALALIHGSGLPSSAFILEITERGVLMDKKIAVQAMQRFVDAGIELSIDDFGTENSNIEILRSIPAKELKIDRSFIRDMTNSKQDRAVVESVINMAHKLGYSVVAEGVETREILDLLTFLGCDKAQGFYISKPLNVIEYTGYLTRENLHKNRRKRPNRVKNL